MIEKVEGFWLCDCGSLNPDEYGICLTPHCYAKKPSVSKHGNTDVMSIPMSTDKPKTSQKRDLTIGSGVSSAKPAKIAFLSYSEYIATYPKSSKTEYDRYCVLWSLAGDGIIQELECQPEFELSPRIVIKPTSLFTKQYTQSREIYTADFRYTISGYTIVEDVKGGKIKGKKRQLKPYVKTAARNKHKSLIVIWHKQGKLDNTRLLFTVWYGKQWHYFDSNQNEIEFSLESQRNAA